MNRLQRTAMWLWAAALLVLTGCATAPPAPKVQMAKGERVGVLVQGSDTLHHSHVGTTVFNNFAVKYPSPGLRADVEREVVDQVRQAGWTAVPLEQQGLAGADVQGAIRFADGQWSVVADKAAVLRRLRDDLKLRAVLVLVEGRSLADLECTGGPCSERYIDGPGLYSRSFMGMSRYAAASGYRWAVLSLDPPADLAQAEKLRPMFRVMSSRLSLTEVADIKVLSGPELESVKAGVLRDIALRTKAALRAFSPS